MKIILTSLPISIIIYITITLLNSSNTQENFEWSETDARFDCVVAITADEKLLGSGVFIAQDTVLTSANVVEDYVTKMGELRVHTIAFKYNESKEHTVGCIVSVFGKGKDRKSSPFWLQHGPQEERENSPVHDLYTLALVPTAFDKTDSEHYSIAVVNKGDFARDVDLRYAFMTRMVWANNYIEHTFYMWGGFAYISEQHVKESFWMDMEIYGEQEVVVDCDEWIPREWGHFICIENVNGNVGVPSGAPLIHKGRLVGIASFMLDKNNDSILAFTDLRAYGKKMQVCINRGRLQNETPIEFGIVNYSEVYAKEARFTKRLSW